MALVYQAKEHRIDPRDIDSDARWVVERLNRARYKAYIVGGAVRDLLTGKKPKDFDIATAAFPRKIRRIFPNSRIIGRRFRIVHVYAYNRKVFEVSTFRSSQDVDNSYGTIEEDVWRRDFTINALYYCPFKNIVIDYVGGFEDIKKKRIKTLVPLEQSFQEDPVRMLRGVKYAQISGYRLPSAIAGAIKQQRKSISKCSPERLTEEVYKILRSGHAAGIFHCYYRLQVLEVLLPALDRYLSGRRRKVQDQFFECLRRLDRDTSDSDEMPRGELLARLFSPWFSEWKRLMPADDVSLLLHSLRNSVHPLLPSKRELETAAAILLGS